MQELKFWFSPYYTTTGNTGIPVKTARKKAERFFFSAFISESENKIVALFQKGEFDILLSLSEINAEKQILPRSFNRYAGISCGPKAKTEILVLAQTFGFVFAQPLLSTSRNRQR